MPGDISPSRVAPRGPDPARHVYWKLGFFSAAIFAAPLSAYYLSIDRLFGGNPNYAGGLAAIVVNIVLLGYIITAFLEDQGDGVKNRTEEHKDSQNGKKGQ